MLYMHALPALHLSQKCSGLCSNMTRHCVWNVEHTLESQLPFSCLDESCLVQEKKASKKAQGRKQPVTDKGETQAQQPDLMEDAQLPPSKRDMPVWPNNSVETATARRLQGFAYCRVRRALTDHFATQ